MTIGHYKGFAKKLVSFKNLHVRVSIKGTNPEEYFQLTGARASSYELPFLALRHLIDAGVSVNACIMASFSTEDGIAQAKNRLEIMHPGILKSLEIERITLFPKVAERLAKKNLKPTHAKRLNRKVYPSRSGERSAAGSTT